jgi:hypothetical protein
MIYDHIVNCECNISITFCILIVTIETNTKTTLSKFIHFELTLSEFEFFYKEAMRTFFFS